jgi:ABC-2 type transport system permease protein
MRNIWLVIKHDVGAMLRQRSFWIFTFFVPVLLLALNVANLFESDVVGSTGSGDSEQGATAPDVADLPVIGLVDEGNLIAEMPPGFPDDLFVRFPDEAAARAALENGAVAQYVHLPADYVSTGQIEVYDRNFQILSTGEDMGVAAFSGNNQWVLPYIINYNLVGDEQLLAALRNPVPGALAESHALKPPAEAGTENQDLARVVGTVLPYIYYFLLVMGGSYLMRSVVAEKENRTAEVLLLSLNPRELMIGKMLAMSVVMWLQVVVWVGGGIFILNRGADALNVAQFSFPPGFVAWAFAFLILGYLLYASVMAAAGAIAPNAREGGQVIWLLVLPLMPTLMFGSAFAEDPNGTLPVVLSLFPFSAPSAMVTRLAVAEVPLWQILISLAGLALIAYLFIVLAGRFFRADNLLSQESFNWRRLATGWRRTG